MNDDNQPAPLANLLALLSEREWKEACFARAYAQHYAHGTDGHSRLMLISKLCDIIDGYTEART